MMMSWYTWSTTLMHIAYERPVLTPERLVSSSLVIRRLLPLTSSSTVWHDRRQTYHHSAGLLSVWPTDGGGREVSHELRSLCHLIGYDFGVGRRPDLPRCGLAAEARRKDTAWVMLGGEQFQLRLLRLRNRQSQAGQTLWMRAGSWVESEDIWT